jgi:hypothetical protein
MPLRRLLEESRTSGRGSFDPKCVAILRDAYKAVIADLGLRAPEEKEKAAKLVIRLAQGHAGLDAIKLRDAVTDSMLNERRSGTEEISPERRL